MLAGDAPNEEAALTTTESRVQGLCDQVISPEG
jgi:hypothetical protein